MTRDRTWKIVQTLACFAACGFFIVFTAQAATSPEATVGRGFGFTYDPAYEITLVGTVKGSGSRPAPGSPIGLHLLISSGGKVVDAHLGPYISKEDQQALHAGELVQIIGVNENVHGKTVLLARQLIFHGRLMTVRTERGFLVRNLGSSPKARDGKAAVNGGIQ